jgi:hypothetical protein
MYCAARITQSGVSALTANARIAAPRGGPCEKAFTAKTTPGAVNQNTMIASKPMTIRPRMAAGPASPPEALPVRNPVARKRIRLSATAPGAQARLKAE